MDTKKKTFDCLEFKRRTQARIYKEIRDMTLDEQLEYFRLRAENGPLGEWWKTKKHSSAAPASDSGGRTDEAADGASGT